jgi:O-antigen/teichoic acid export membrane protein
VSGPGVGRATLTYAGAELGARAAWFAVVLLLSCLLPQRDFGAWSLLMALAGLLEIGLTLGLHGSAVRWFYDRDEASYGRVLFTLLTVWLLGSAALGLGLELAGRAGFHHLVDQPGWSGGGRLALGVAWLGAATALPLAMLNARRQAAGYAALRTLHVAGPVVGVLALLSLGRRDAEGVLLGHLLGALLPALAALVLTSARSRPPPAWRELGSLLAFGLPVLPHMMAQWVLSWSDRWLLERLLDLEAVAVYHLAYLPALAVLLLGGALNRGWYPVLYEQLERLDRAEHRPGEPPYTSAASPRGAPDTEPGRAAWSALRSQSRAALTMMAGLGALTALWAGELLRVLPTDGYDASPGLAAFTAAGTGVSLLYLLPHNLLYHHRSTAPIPWMTGLAAGLNLLLNLALIPFAGPLGAALATVVAYAALALLFWWRAGRTSRLPVRPVELLRCAGPALAVMVVAMLLGLASPGWPWRIGAELTCSLALLATLLRGDGARALRALLTAR